MWTSVSPCPEELLHHRVLSQVVITRLDIAAQVIRKQKFKGVHHIIVSSA